MAADTQSREHAHHLLDQLGPGQLEAVVKLLEVMIRPDEDEALTEEDGRSVAASREYFRRNPQDGVPFEQVVADCGFTMDEIRDYKGEQ